MWMPNPSEMMRVEEELTETIKAVLDRRTVTPFFTSDKGYKSARQALLNELRRLERQLGFRGEDYNNSNFRTYYENILKELNHG